MKGRLDFTVFQLKSARCNLRIKESAVLQYCCVLTTQLAAYYVLRPDYLDYVKNPYEKPQLKNFYA